MSSILASFLARNSKKNSVVETETPKKILLIIDPQNDFHENSLLIDGEVKNGSLAVGHSVEDAEKIVKLINNGKFDEIHVSLDTHTYEHIGHPGFYEKGHSPLGFYDGTQIAKDEELPKDYLTKYNKTQQKS